MFSAKIHKNFKNKHFASPDKSLNIYKIQPEHNHFNVIKIILKRIIWMKIFKKEYCGIFPTNKSKQKINILKDLKITYTARLKCRKPPLSNLPNYKLL